MTTDETPLFRLKGTALVAAPPEPEPAPAVADSFLLQDGHVVAWNRHWQRFSSAAQDVGITPTVLADFRSAVVRHLARASGFPRLEVTADGTSLQLRMRPTGQLQTTSKVLVGPNGDPRKHPRRKGPDFAVCAELLEHARRHDCDEYLICDTRGRALECCYASLVWWRDGTLYALPDDAPVLPGVTRTVILALADKDGIPVAFDYPDLAVLRQGETWLLNARHGIRVVTHWGNHPATHADTGRRDTWQHRLWDLVEPIREADAKFT